MSKESPDEIERSVMPEKTHANRESLDSTVARTG